MWGVYIMQVRHSPLYTDITHGQTDTVLTSFTLAHSTLLYGLLANHRHVMQQSHYEVHSFHGQRSAFQWLPNHCVCRLTLFGKWVVVVDMSKTPVVSQTTSGIHRQYSNKYSWPGYRDKYSWPVGMQSTVWVTPHILV